MEKLHLCVIPAKAGIHWLHVLRDPCLRRDDGEEAFTDTLVGGNPSAEDSPYASRTSTVRIWRHEKSTKSFPMMKRRKRDI
jgi:hypothetical protein